MLVILKEKTVNFSKDRIDEFWVDGDELIYTTVGDVNVEKLLLRAKDEVEAHKIYDKITLGWRNNWSEVLLREQTSE